jgi:hypothetical protein
MNLRAETGCFCAYYKTLRRDSVVADLMHGPRGDSGLVPGN